MNQLAREALSLLPIVWLGNLMQLPNVLHYVRLKYYPYIMINVCGAAFRKRIIVHWDLLDQRDSNDEPVSSSHDLQMTINKVLTG